MTRRVAIAAVAIVVVVAALLVLRRSAPPSTPDAARAVSSSGAPPEPSAAAAMPGPVREAYEVPEPTRPASLRGTEVDGELLVDGDGHLLLTPGALRLFDYFLTTLGEVSLDEIRQLVAVEARRRLPPAAADEAIALFEQYLGYLDAAQAEARAAPPVAGDAVSTARAQLTRLEALQQARFGDRDAGRLFADDNALAHAILDRNELALRDDLSPDEKRAQLEAVEARLPPAMREARARMQAPAQAREEVEALRRRGGSAAEIHAVRARYFGEEAADRLDALDRSRGEP